MAIEVRDLRAYGSDVMAEDDSTTNVGGAIKLDVQVVFTEVVGTVQAVSDDSADTEDITVFYRNAGQIIQTETVALTGTTPVPFTATMARLLKAEKAGTTGGNVAVEAQIPTRSGTAQSGDTEWIQLDAGASDVDGAYRSKVCRLTGGPGQGQIRRGVLYTGADQKFYPNRPWSPAPTSSTTFRIADGFFFEVEPHECFEVRRLHYAAEADVLGGADRDYYDKFFIKNLGDEALVTAMVSEFADPEAQFDFALATTVDDSGTNAGTRQVAPTSGVTVFDGFAKAVPGVDLGSGDSIGVWSHLAIPAGDISTDSRVAFAMTGS